VTLPRDRLAGEHDLDAPPDITSDPRGQRAVEAGFAPNPSVAPAQARLTQSRTSGIPPVREDLPADDSAAVRAQLVCETKALSEDGLPSRASAILKAKNRLPADGAELVEDAFAGRMGRADAAWEALATDEPTSVPAGQPRPNRSQRPPSPSSDQGDAPERL
jgi:hypothetical protein